MIKYEFKDSTGTNWVRISKAQAKKLFESGENVCFCPCKSRPFGGDSVGHSAGKDDYKSLQQWVESFEFCSCNPETGKYTSFYKMEV